MRDRPPFSRYIAILMVSVLGTFLLLWGYTFNYRSNFLPESYGTWRAVMRMVDTCDTGDVAILGASQASVDLMPGELGLPVSAKNYALTASTPLEAFYLARRLFSCPAPPKTAVIVYAGYDFANSGYFWDRTARYGLLSFSDLQDVARTAATVDDTELYHGAFGAEPPPTIKNFLYSSHFPPYDFKSLLAAKGGNRRRDNERLTAETLAQQGQHLIGDEACSTVHGWEADHASFSPTRLNVTYFDRLITLLHDKGVNVLFMSPPMSDLTHRDLHGHYAEEFTSFLRRVRDRYSEVTLVGPVFPTLDHCLFSDPVHLNGRGAAAFSRTAGRMISAALAEARL